MWTKTPPCTDIHLSTYDCIQRSTEVEEPMSQLSFGFAEPAMSRGELNLKFWFLCRLVDSWIYATPWDLLKLSVLLSISEIKTSLKCSGEFGKDWWKLKGQELGKYLKKKEKGVTVVERQSWKGEHLAFCNSKKAKLVQPCMVWESAAQSQSDLKIWGQFVASHLVWIDCNQSMLWGLFVTPLSLLSWLQNQYCASHTHRKSCLPPRRE